MAVVIIDCAALWRRFMVEVAMAVVIVGGCGCKQWRKWRSLLMATERADLGKGGQGQGHPRGTTPSRDDGEGKGDDNGEGNSNIKMDVVARVAARVRERVRVMASRQQQQSSTATVNGGPAQVSQAFTGTLNDEAFVRDLMSSIVGAMVQASREEELTHSFMDVVTTAVTKALADEKFVMELWGAITSTLQDGEIYKAGARGMVSAAFGLRKGSNDDKMIDRSATQRSKKTHSDPSKVDQ
jgi:hypothetical protein